MNENYTGRHRPTLDRTSMWNVFKADQDHTRRDYEARWFGYDYEPRHSADFPREVAA